MSRGCGLPQDLNHSSKGCQGIWLLLMAIDAVKETKLMIPWNLASQSYRGAAWKFIEEIQMASKDWSKFRWGWETGIKAEFMTSLGFFFSSPASLEKTSKVSEMYPETVYSWYHRSSVWNGGGPVCLAKRRRTETRDNVEAGQGRPGLGGWDLCD